MDKILILLLLQWGVLLSTIFRHVPDKQLVNHTHSVFHTPHVLTEIYRLSFWVECMLCVQIQPPTDTVESVSKNRVKLHSFSHFLCIRPMPQSLG